MCCARAVRTRQAHVYTVDAGGRRDDDADLVPVHTERAVLPVGRVLHRVHRAGRSRLHGPVEREPGLDIHGEPDHVHRLLRGLHRAHMLRVHVLGGGLPGGTGAREPVRARAAHHAGRDQHRAGRVRAHPGRQLHIHGVLQDDIPGDRVRRAPRHVPAAGAAVAVRAGRVLLQAAPFVRRQVVARTPVQYTAPVAAAAPPPPAAAATARCRGAAGLWQAVRARRAQEIRQQGRLQVGQGHGSGHVRGVQREQLVQVAAAQEEGGGRGRGAAEEVHGGLEEGHGPFDAAAAARHRRRLPQQRLLQRRGQDGRGDAPRSRHRQLRPADQAPLSARAASAAAVQERRTIPLRQSRFADVYTVFPCKRTVRNTNA